MPNTVEKRSSSNSIAQVQVAPRKIFSRSHPINASLLEHSTNQTKLIHESIFNEISVSSYTRNTLRNCRPITHAMQAWSFCIQSTNPPDASLRVRGVLVPEILVRVCTLSLHRVLSFTFTSISKHKCDELLHVGFGLGGVKAVFFCHPSIQLSLCSGGCFIFGPLLVSLGFGPR